MRNLRAWADQQAGYEIGGVGCCRRIVSRKVAVQYVAVRVPDRVLRNVNDGKYESLNVGAVEVSATIHVSVERMAVPVLSSTSHPSITTMDSAYRSADFATGLSTSGGWTRTSDLRVMREICDEIDNS